MKLFKAQNDFVANTIKAFLPEIKDNILGSMDRDDYNGETSFEITTSIPYAKGLYNIFVDVYFSYHSETWRDEEGKPDGRCYISLSVKKIEIFTDWEEEECEHSINVNKIEGYWEED